MKDPIDDMNKKDSYQAAILFCYHLQSVMIILQDHELLRGLEKVKKDSESRVSRDLAEIYIKEIIEFRDNNEFFKRNIWTIPNLIWDLTINEEEV